MNASTALRATKRIAVFCAANPVADVYVQSTQSLGTLMVAHGFDLVWGGSDKGLMKVIAESVEAAGGKTYGVSVELLKASARKSATEMIIAKTISERKGLLLAKADAIICLVGGIGSLDEITEILELKKHKQHSKPVVFLNTNGFYTGLKTQLERMETEGFLTQPVVEMVYFADTPEAALTYITSKLF